MFFHGGALVPSAAQGGAGEGPKRFLLDRIYRIRRIDRIAGRARRPRGRNVYRGIFPRTGGKGNSRTAPYLPL